MYVVTNILLVLVFGVGAILLQIFLSRRQSRWPGLILPALTLLYSLAMVLHVANTGDLASALLAMGITFLLGNLLTLILLVIYAACREKYRKKKQMEKMDIQDLE